MQTKIDYISLYSLYAILEKIKVHKKRIYIFIKCELMHEVKKTLICFYKKNPEKQPLLLLKERRLDYFYQNLLIILREKKNREKIFKTQIQWYR